MLVNFYGVCSRENDQEQFIQEQEYVKMKDLVISI